MISIIFQTIRERKWSYAIYIAISVLLLLLYVALFPSLQSQSQQLAEVLKTMPANLLKALGSSADQLSNFTLEALLASKQFSFPFQMLAIILGVAVAGTDISGEIENGTITFLLSQPVSRMKLYFSKYLAEVMMLTIFVAASTLVVIPLAVLFHVDYNAGIYFKLFWVAELFTIAVFSFSYMLSALFSTRGKVFGIASGLFALMYIVFIFSAIKESLDKLKYLSFFHYFSPDILYSGTIDKLGVGIFVAVIIVTTSIGAIYFVKRDITA